LVYTKIPSRLEADKVGLHKCWWILIKVAGDGWRILKKLKDQLIVGCKRFKEIHFLFKNSGVKPLFLIHN